MHLQMLSKDSLFYCPIYIFPRSSIIRETNVLCERKRTNYPATSMRKRYVNFYICGLTKLSRIQAWSNFDDTSNNNVTFNNRSDVTHIRRHSLPSFHDILLATYKICYPKCSVVASVRKHNSVEWTGCLLVACSSLNLEVVLPILQQQD